MNRALQEILELPGGIEVMYDQLNDFILFTSRGKSTAQFKKELKDDPPEVLQHVSDIALATEQYEICTVIKQLQQ